MSKPKNSEEPSIAEQLHELDELIAWFDQSDFDLDEALAKFEHGTKLAEALETRLTKLDNKITVLRRRFDQSGPMEPGK